MKKARIYFTYCCIAIVSAIITYSFMSLKQPQVHVKTVIIEKVVPTTEDSLSDEELETLLLEELMDEWGPV